MPLTVTWGYTDGLISFGTRGLLCKASKQKLNTKTEAELVGASDYLVNTIWLRIFLEAQGFIVTSNILEQNNQSAICLEQNSKKTAGKQSRHINICYFYIKDRIDQDGITIQHCDTENMIADFFTKPLPGCCSAVPSFSIRHYGAGSHGVFGPVSSTSVRGACWRSNCT